MTTLHGGLSVVFNGEIYNFRSLRSELESRGHRFRTESDTEALLHGWREWGEGLPQKLEGMFAFGIWEEPTRRLTLVRDRAGQKPVHYTRSESTLAFASEPAALRGLPGPGSGQGGAFEVDVQAMASYLALGYVPAPHSIWCDVEVLPPGHLLTVSPEGVGQARRWWRFDPRPEPMSSEDAARRVRTLLATAVERRTIADVPLGALLSGGVDSTAVTALLQRFSDHPVRTFSLGFDDPVYDEGDWARRAADHLGTQHTHQVVEAPDAGVIDEIATSFGVPFADSSAIPMRIVSRIAREEVTVALTGDAGDELFAGYWRMHAVGLAAAIPGSLAGPASTLARLLPGGDFRSLARRAERLLDAARLPAPERLATWGGVFAGAAVGLLRDDVRAGVDGQAWLSTFEKVWAGHVGAVPLLPAVHATFETYLPEDLLVKADRTSMEYGLELRSPFLDSELVDFCATIPPALHRRGNRLKAVLKDAVADVVPADILDRPKQGFGVPLPRWLRGPWRASVEARLRDSASPLFAWLDHGVVDQLVVDHLDRGIDREHQIWALLVLEAWLREQQG